MANPASFGKKEAPPGKSGRGLEIGFLGVSRLLGVVDFRGCRHFLELGKRAEGRRLLFARAAAGGGKKSESGNGKGGDDSEHGGSEMGFFEFRQKNDLAGEIQDGAVLGGA